MDWTYAEDLSQLSFFLQIERKEPARGLSWKTSSIRDPEEAWIGAVKFFSRTPALLLARTRPTFLSRFFFFSLLFGHKGNGTPLTPSSGSLIRESRRKERSFRLPPSPCRLWFARYPTPDYICLPRLKPPVSLLWQGYEMSIYAKKVGVALVEDKIRESCLRYVDCNKEGSITNDLGDDTLLAKLHLVNLAGSERANVLELMGCI
ncbi:uncharacterized protein LOC114578833 [Dendrobium catenatum]|uniref:uncharacterized protein LOC114578833 n=1 Tax=Dendrobium catenatum TaxID=906689 RepID=UPI00109FBC8D|nr:uncharacterized protein LOC114578833 [Dendrobium catenatum]